MSVPPPPPPGGSYPPIPRKRKRPPRTPQWWDRPLGAVLTVVGLALVVLILANAGSGAATLSKYVCGAAFVFVIVVGIGLAFLMPSRAVWMWVAIIWIVPVTLLWVGVEHWLDWHAFRNTSGSRRNRVTTPLGAKIQGSFFILLGIGGLAFWVALPRGVRKRGAGGVSV